MGISENEKKELILMTIMGAVRNVCFDKILKINPDDIEACSKAWCEIADDVSWRGFYKEAIFYYDKSIELNPNNTVAKSNKMWALRELFDNDRYVTAKGNLDETIRLHSEDFEHLFEIGEKYLCQGRFYEAKVCFDEVIRLNPNYLATCINTLWREAMKKNSVPHGRVIPYLDEIIRLEPNDSSIYAVWVERAELLEDNGLFNEAIACHNQASMLNPEYSEEGLKACSNVWSHKGVGFMSKGMCEEAIVCFDEAIKLNPDSEIAQRSKEMVLRYKERGVDNEVKMPYMESRKFHPDYTSVFIYLTSIAVALIIIYLIK